jgi:hypothetical protein
MHLQTESRNLTDNSYNLQSKPFSRDSRREIAAPLFCTGTTHVNKAFSDYY